MADLRLPAVQDSGLNMGLGSGGSRAMRVLDKARAQQVDMERKEQNNRKQLENIYLSGGKNAPGQDRESRQPNMQPSLQ